MSYLDSLRKPEASALVLQLAQELGQKATELAEQVSCAAELSSLEPQLTQDVLFRAAVLIESAAAYLNDLPRNDG